MNPKPCKSCGYRMTIGNNQYACGQTKIPIENIETSFCSNHLSQSAIIKCSICGNLMNNKTSFITYLSPTDETPLTLCGNCNSSLGTCATCKETNHCLFETSSNPLPKQIQQQVRQGNMIMQTIVKNPERIKVTCANGCTCFDPINNLCLREEPVGCSKWHYK